MGGGINKIKYLLFASNFGVGSSFGMNKRMDDMLNKGAPTTFVSIYSPVSTSLSFDMNKIEHIL